MDEQQLITKYKNAGIIKGSLCKGRGKHSGKNTVRCKCRCGKVQTIATSDLWLKNCDSCGEKLNRKRGAK
jgi:hypothetical protein